MKTGNPETSTHYEIKPINSNMSTDEYIKLVKTIKLVPKGQ